MKRRSGRHQYKRIRDDHATELAEDYVEAIAEIIDAQEACRVTDLAKHFGVSHVTVIRTLRRLERDGFVSVKQNEPVELTQDGVVLAESSKHRLGVPEKTAAVDSEGIEHHVSTETLRRMGQFIRQTEQAREG